MPRWLEEWFQRRTEAVFAGEDVPALFDIPVSVIAAGLGEPGGLAGVVRRLLSVEPRFFRGFRTLAEPITLAGGLVVIEGRNSSGKTSLAEALEWLFTGTLSRRDLRGQGHPRELERCVGNQFRPPEEETWVEVVFELDAGERLTIRRVLVEDYGTALGSQCASRVIRDGVGLADSEATALMDALFGGCPPLLMQHTLRLFVHSEPSDRRRYFERLLRLDELTQLIGDAVIGDRRLADFPSPTGSAALRRWEAFKRELTTPVAKSRARVDRRPPEELAEALRAVLPTIAYEELKVGAPALSYVEMRDLMAAEQRTARQRSFPLLSELRPKRLLDDSLAPMFEPDTYARQLAVVRAARERLVLAEQSASDITEAQFAVARAVAQLAEAGLIAPDGDMDITCPVCEFPDAPSLRRERLGTIRTWEPARSAVQTARESSQRATNGLLDSLRALVRTRRELLPRQPADEQWTAALAETDPSIAAATTVFRDASNKEHALLERFDEELIAAGRLLSASMPTETVLDEVARHLDGIAALLPQVPAASRRYGAALMVLEQTVGTRASAGTSYAQRDTWLAVGEAADAIAADFAWERAKFTMQDALKRIRDALIGVRQHLLDLQRSSFSDGMNDVWKALRADTYSSFGQLVIPEPSGKGYPIEIQVKARLDDGKQIAEVDALRVFSESQVNALGIAAFVTRAKLLGHRVAVFDDPVQSMDEEHFKTFASGLLSHLLDEGFQVIVLTHNDIFARDVSYAHFERDGYATVKIAHSRRRGCRVDYDNRRVRERLARAKRLAEDGDEENGWKVVRLAIERLYVIARMKHGAVGFNPASWMDQAAESMYKQGIDEILDRVAPGRSDRMKEILDMTAAGAHDKAARGATDLLNAIEFVRATGTTLAIND